jgi:diphosphomevalonate decarboxylase
METNVILVDENDVQVGTMGKLRAHQEGLLHRAFSIFIYRYHDEQCEVLLQRRHPDKYHSGGLWTNTCCSHPTPQESIQVAAARRLKEELGITANLKEVGVFHYRATVGNGLIENEIDHVLIGEMVDDNYKTDPTEIAGIAWITVEDLQKQLRQSPEKYTAWLEQALDIFLKFNN